MRPRVILLFISIIAIGGIVLPQTVSLFAGQHYWYNLSTSENDVPCEKCHADIAEEMNQIHGPHTGETGYAMFECEYCHRTFPISTGNINQTISQNYLYTYATVNSSVIPGKEAHAASTTPCMYCHSGGNTGDIDCTSCHPGGGTYADGHGGRFPGSDKECVRCHEHPGQHVPFAGGFNLTANSTDTGSLAAHKKFVDKSMNNNLMEDANEACIACHTHIAVKINFSHARTLEFRAGQGYPVTTDHGPHNWTVTEWKCNGTAYATTWGNTSGNSTTSYGEIEWPGNVGDIYS